MKCSICKTGTTKKGKVTVKLEKEGSIVLIKEVPAQICNHCGHYYLDNEMTKMVLKKGKESIGRGTELELIKYQPV
jgi:YgiT-type zinc finger domain-containing protein